MGDKNNTVEILNCDVTVVARHAILKAAYVVNGNAGYSVKLYDHCTTCMVACNGCLVATICGAAVGVNMPYLNTPLKKGLVADVTGCGGGVLVIYE